MPDGQPRLPERWPRREPEPDAIVPAERTAVQRMESLTAQLEATIRGEVRVDTASRAIYSTDASNYRYVPLGVVLPRDKADVIETVETASRLGVPIVHRGGGTGLAGQTTNGALVIDHSKYVDEIVEVDPTERRARVQPGTILDDLRERTREHGLTFGPDPATHDCCTIGGMLGNNSCGIHSQMAGRTSDNTLEMEVMTYDGERMRVGPTSPEELEATIDKGGRVGEIYRKMRDLRDEYADLIRERFPDIPRRVSGYNLDELLPENDFNVARALVGTEGTCATILEATVRLIPSRPQRALVALGFDDIYEAADAVPRILEHDPIALEGIDETLVDNMRKKRLHLRDIDLLPEGDGWLLVEFGADTLEEADDRAEEMTESIRQSDVSPSVQLYDDPVKESHVWEIRESGLGATARVPGQRDTWPGWEDSAVPPERLGDYLRDLQQLYDDYDYQGALYGHFGQGCVHSRITFDLQSPDGRRRYRSFVEEAADLCTEYGGSLSGEHGDGQSRGELLETMYGPELVEAFREFRAIWDPEHHMNPGKVADARPLDEDLSQAADRWEPETTFQFPHDDGSFRRATDRCVGVGKCRRKEEGTMCPSFHATREEMHTTRGRARLLQEMLVGEETPADWDNPDVEEALDLCLACKGCKTECPVDVDMATYKAEFLSHYYEHNSRPRTAYAMGFVDRWAQLASAFPRAVNVLMATPGLSSVLKMLGGITTARDVPTFSTATFRDWYQDLERGSPSPRGAVLLWPDTFNNYFHPEKLVAAHDSLEALGFEVVTPTTHLCCGRPLYDYGFLETAKSYLDDVLETVGPVVADGVPLVGLEPSCAAVFRDELVDLYPNDDRARALHDQTYTFAEFIDAEVDETLPGMSGTVGVHTHCHEDAVLDPAAEPRLFDRLGFDCQVLETGCCGMAGAFGFDEETYDVSLECAEVDLLPHLEGLEDDALLAADGFSCSTQIAELTDREPLHAAQLLQLGLWQAGRLPYGP